MCPDRTAGRARSAVILQTAKQNVRVGRVLADEISAKTGESATLARELARIKSASMQD
jgi:hypothetical protein